MESNKEYETPQEVKEIYMLMGSISSTWSHIENAVDVTIWELAQVEPAFGACITAQIQSLHYRLFALSALVQQRGCGPEIIKKINQFDRCTQPLSEKRNRVIHDPVVTESDGKLSTLVISAKKKGLTFGLFHDKISEYTKINDEISSLLKDYLSLEREISGDIEKRMKEINALRPIQNEYNIGPTPLD